MILWIAVILFIPILWNILECNKKTWRQNEFLYIIGFLLLVICGLRSYVTFNDTDSYVLHFSQVSDAGSIWSIPQDRFEKGYLVYEKFIHKYIGHNYTYLLLFQTFIVISTSFCFIKRKCKYAWFALFLFIGWRVFFLEIQAERQGIAMGLSYLAILLLENTTFKNIFISIVLLCVAYFFHSSSICVFLLVPLTFFRVTKKNTIKIFFLSALILLFLGYIISILGREDSIYLADDGGRLGDYLNLIISIFIILYVYRYHIVTLDKDRLLFWGAILSVSMCFLALYIPILTRVAVYFRLYSIVLFANVIKDRQSFGYRTIEKPIIFLIFILYTYCLYAKPEWNRAYPYFFFWESDLPFKLPI